MKLSAIFFIGLLAYTVVASDDESDGGEGEAGEEPGTNQFLSSNQYAGQQRYYYPAPAPTYRPPQRSFIQRLLSSPIGLLLLIQILTPVTTTTAATTTVEPTTTAIITTVPDTTMVETTTAPVTATTSPYSDWVNPRNTNCRYEMQRTPATWAVAQTVCQSLGANLASAGFGGLTSLERSTFIAGVGGSSTTFWVAVTADEGPSGSINDATDAYIGGSSDPSTDGITLTLAQGSGTGLCGRFDSADTNLMLFEPCSARAFAYLCEYCGSI